MTAIDRSAHWETVYSTKGEREVSWFEENPELSLSTIDELVPTSASVIDIGAGASRLVDGLVARGQAHVTVLDLSATALETAKARIAGVGDVAWVASMSPNGRRTVPMTFGMIGRRFTS